MNFSLLHTPEDLDTVDNVVKVVLVVDENPTSHVYHLSGVADINHAVHIVGHAGRVESFER